MSDVTLILEAISRGESQASEDLLPLVYDELRKLAAARMPMEELANAIEEERGVGENIPKEEREDEFVGSAVGPYKLLQRIGEGGCGVVYMAEQEKPVRRRVALKIIKLGMDTKSVISRPPRISH